LGRTKVFSGLVQVTKGGGLRFGEEMVNELGRKTRPREKVAIVNCRREGGDGGTEEGRVEELEQIGSGGGGQKSGVGAVCRDRSKRWSWWWNRVLEVDHPQAWGLAGSSKHKLVVVIDGDRVRKKNGAASMVAKLPNGEK
jgi:hypothetical protein